MRRALLAVAAVTLCLGIAEGLLRAFDLPRFDACSATADFAVPDPELGFRGAPGASVGGFTLNADGLRGERLATPKPAGEHRILFVGDSTCWGLGVGLDESFAGRSAAALGSRFALGAFPGYSSYQSAIVLERMLPLEPDLVVFYVGARNDGSRARYFPDDEIPARKARLQAAWHDVRVLRLLEVGRDHAYRNLVRRFRSRLARARVPPDVFRANLEGMLDRLARRGIPALVVIPPLSPRFEAEAPQMRRYREILDEVTRARAVPSVRVDARFAAREPDEVYFEDDYHLRAPGHAIVAEAIVSALAVP